MAERRRPYTGRVLLGSLFLWPGATGIINDLFGVRLGAASAIGLLLSSAVLLGCLLTGVLNRSSENSSPVDDSVGSDTETVGFGSPELEPVEQSETWATEPFETEQFETEQFETEPFSSEQTPE